MSAQFKSVELYYTKGKELYYLVISFLSREFSACTLHFSTSFLEIMTIIRYQLLHK